MPSKARIPSQRSRLTTGHSRQQHLLPRLSHRSAHQLSHTRNQQVNCSCQRDGVSRDEWRCTVERFLHGGKVGYEDATADTDAQLLFLLLAEASDFCISGGTPLTVALEVIKGLSEGHPREWAAKYRLQGLEMLQGTQFARLLREVGENRMQVLIFN